MEEETKMTKEEKRNQALIEKYGFQPYCPSPDDQRDYRIDDVMRAAPPLPEEYRTEGKIAIMNQGASSMCVAFACAAAMGYGELKYDASKDHHDYSRGYIYGNREANQYQGEGMIMREALRQLNHYGDCLHDDFDVWDSYAECKRAVESDKKNLDEKASPYKIVNYFRLYGEDEIKRALIQQGAVIMSIPVYSGFGKHIQLPKKGEQSKGGHCMCCVGWNKEGWILANSWSTTFGDKGYCYLPYDYPAQEWWGLTVNKNLPIFKKKNLFVRIARLLCDGIAFCGQHIKMFFNSLFHKNEQ